MPQPYKDEIPPTEPIQALPAAAAALKSPQLTRAISESLHLNMADSDGNLSNIAYRRRSNPSTASLYSSTLSPPGSRPMSPAGTRRSSSVLPSSVFEPPAGKPLPEGVGDKPGDPLNLILTALVPHVSIQASPGVEELFRNKGFKNGFWELLRPFGERIQGKISVRDSNGVSRLAENFSVRFTKFGANIQHPDLSNFRQSQIEGQNGNPDSLSRDRKVLSDVDAVVDRHLSYAEDSYINAPFQGLPTSSGIDIDSTSPYYTLYLRRLLSNLPVTPHETFAHPVASIIAVSAQSPDSVAELGKMYNDSTQGNIRLPLWVDAQYLRYYVLVHDEENDDITRSMALFEQMKRHFGLHCHLLRIRSSQCLETDDDSIPLPRSDWMSAEEELEQLRRSEDDEEFEDPTRYIFESDVTAIQSFVREMATQSIIPNMERSVSVWNDQVASKRRGLTGRFMNLSRKWTSFGSSSRSTPGPGGFSKDNYDPAAGFFRADAPEAIMRKLADYAFMLRDFKLAHSTYDLIRTDFHDSKAWKYHAGANEMAAVSMLMMSQQLSARTRAETIDQMLEAAFYSYLTRSSAPYGALRSITLTLELLRLRGGTNIDDAGRWGIRLLESRIPGPVGDALLKERLAVCYASKEGVGSWGWGSRKRKSAAWSILAADAWVSQGKHIPAQRCLTGAQNMYASQNTSEKGGIGTFREANDFMTSLQHGLSARLMPEPGDTSTLGGDGAHDVEEEIDEESEALTDTRRPRRTSTVIAPSVIETSPLHENEETAEKEPAKGFDQS